MDTTDTEPICDVTGSTHCHLQGVRYVPRKCEGKCELLPETPARARVSSLIEVARASMHHAIEEPEIQHDEECGEQIMYGGCCKHYCPTGEHKVER